MAQQSRPPAPVYDAARVAELLGIISFTAKDVAAFGKPPEPLHGFLTFLDPGWSIVSLRDRMGAKEGVFLPQSWYEAESFAKRGDQPRYRQLRMEAVQDSLDKSFVDQQQLLGPDEEVPLARVVIMGMVLHFLATGERLFHANYVRCKDTDSDGHRVGVGNFDSVGFHVSYYWDDDRHDLLGLASSRNVP